MKFTLTDPLFEVTRWAYEDSKSLFLGKNTWDCLFPELNRLKVNGNITLIVSFT